MPFRMADYRLRVYRRFPQKEMVQVVIYLRQTSSELVYQTSFELNNLTARFEVVRLWEVEPEVLLDTPGLLPYAVLAQSDNPEQMLQQVVARLEQVPDANERNNLTAATSILSGLRLKAAVISRLIRSEIMRESVIYQQILAEGEAKGEARGRQQGECELVLRLLNRRVGVLSSALQARVRGLSVVRLEELGEALLDFTGLTDLETWLS